MDYKSDDLNRSFELLASSYVNDCLKPNDKKIFENALRGNKNLTKICQRKKAEKEFVGELIPFDNLSIDKRKELQVELSLIDESLFPAKGSFSLVNKVKEALLKKVGR